MILITEKRVKNTFTNIEQSLRKSCAKTATETFVVVAVICVSYCVVVVAVAIVDSATLPPLAGIT